MRNVLATLAAVLSITTIVTPAVAQQLDIRPADRIFDPATGTPVSALRYYEVNGRARFLDAFSASQNYCDASGHQNRANRYNGYDLDLRGSIGARGRNGSASARFAGDVLEYYEDRADDRNREVARFRRGFCSDLRRLSRRLD